MGTYLVPMLVEAGHDVVVVNRGARKPYRPHAACEQVKMIRMDRTAYEKRGIFGEEIRRMAGEVVIDMICFDPGSARQLTEAIIR